MYAVIIFGEYVFIEIWAIITNIVKQDKNF